MLKIACYNGLAALPPHPYFMITFFLAQRSFQLAALWKVWTQNKNTIDHSWVHRYAWAFVIGNLCTAPAIYFIVDSQPSLLQPVLNLMSQNLSQISIIFPLVRELESNAYERHSLQGILTSIAAKLVAGCGILVLLRDSEGLPLTVGVQLATGILFAVVANASDWVYGECAVYDVLAVVVGLGGDWEWWAWLALVMALIGNLRWNKKWC